MLENRLRMSAKLLDDMFKLFQDDEMCDSCKISGGEKKHVNGS